MSRIFAPNKGGAGQKTERDYTKEIGPQNIMAVLKTAPTLVDIANKSSDKVTQVGSYSLEDSFAVAYVYPTRDMLSPPPGKELTGYEKKFLEYYEAYAASKGDEFDGSVPVRVSQRVSKEDSVKDLSGRASLIKLASTGIGAVAEVRDVFKNPVQQFNSETNQIETKDFIQEGYVLLEKSYVNIPKGFDVAQADPSKPETLPSINFYYMTNGPMMGDLLNGTSEIGAGEWLSVRAAKAGDKTVNEYSRYKVDSAVAAANIAELRAAIDTFVAISNERQAIIDTMRTTQSKTVPGKTIYEIAGMKEASTKVAQEYYSYAGKLFKLNESGTLELPGVNYLTIQLLQNVSSPDEVNDALRDYQRIRLGKVAKRDAEGKPIKDAEGKSVYVDQTTDDIINYLSSLIVNKDSGISVIDLIEAGKMTAVVIPTETEKHTAQPGPGYRMETLGKNAFYLDPKTDKVLDIGPGAWFGNAFVDRGRKGSSFINAKPDRTGYLDIVPLEAIPTPVTPAAYANLHVVEAGRQKELVRTFIQQQKEAKASNEPTEPENAPGGHTP